MSEKIIKVQNLTTKISGNLIHDKISFDVFQGEIFGILGSSGAGKSTLLRQMILLQQFQAGSIEILGKELWKITQQDSLFLRQNWGVLFQFGALFSSLSVLENITFLLEEYTKLPKNLANEIAVSKLKMVGLDPSVAKQNPNELSGGMRKRVALARALVLDPRIVFLDEPTSGLDPKGAKAFDELIVELRNMLKFSVIVVTHDLDTIATALDRFIILDNKKIYFDGSYEEGICKNDPFLNQFLKQG